MYLELLKPSKTFTKRRASISSPPNDCVDLPGDQNSLGNLQLFGPPKAAGASNHDMLIQRCSCCAINSYTWRVRMSSRERVFFLAGSHY